jgi:light-regulated signal transduction histidine kinase (bacteriophytochrome)
VGKGELLKEPIDLHSVLHQTLSDLSRAIRESNAVITATPLPTVNGNPRQMGQLLQNLISNAIKYRSTQAPEIQIKAVRQDRYWTISVQDNGIGIDPQFAERIFVIFQRLHAKDEYDGTGIGLAICKKIVERHGGRIWIESQLGKGTTFFFTLPVL